MKKGFIYTTLFLLLIFYSCLDTPDMTGGIVNMKEEPTVITKTDPVFSNEKFTLIVKGEILSYGKNSSFFQQGFCWGTDSVRLTDSVFFAKNNTVETDIFSHELQNLNGNLTYYWRAVAKNQYGTALGGIQEYKTPSEEPSVVSGDNSDYPSDGVLVFKGEILAFGKINDRFEKGFCWGFTSNLTDTIYIEDDNFDLHTFSHTFLNARGDTSYYWRAFARNDYGISLGDVRTYTTSPVFKIEGTFTGQQRSNFAFFTLKNALYITCGNNNNMVFPDVWRYENRLWWKDVNDIPGSARRNPVAFTINDSLAYVGTGQGLSGSQRPILGDFYVFNGNTQTWKETSIATPAEMPRYDAVAFSLNNKGYIVGGNNETGILNDVWEYSLENGEGSWTRMNNFPKPFYKGISFNNKERVFAGFGNNSDAESTLWEYDAANDRWNEFITALPNYPQGGRAKIRSGVIIRDKIYLLDVINNIWELDLATKQYKQKRTLPGDFPLQNEQYMFSLDDVIYIGMGETELFYRYYPFWDN